MSNNKQDTMENTTSNIESSLYRELMNYNRELIVENENLKIQLRELRKSWEEIKNEAILLRDSLKNEPNHFYLEGYQSVDPEELFKLNSEHPLEKAGEIANDFFNYTNSISKKTEIPQQQYFNKKKKKKGTQVLIDPNIAERFKKTLASSGLPLSQVACAMMLIFVDRGRYRNIIVDRVRKRNWVSNKSRKTTPLAWGYPEGLGFEFNAVLGGNKMNQYQAMEIMMEEYCQNNWMQKLVVEYIERVKHNY